MVFTYRSLVSTRRFLELRLQNRLETDRFRLTADEGVKLTSRSLYLYCGVASNNKGSRRLGILASE